jgi:hypothetical protein
MDPRLYPSGRTPGKTAAIDFSGFARVAGRTLIKAGSYGAKLACPAGSGQSQVSMHTRQTGTSFTYQSFRSLGLAGAGAAGVVGDHFTLDLHSGGTTASAHTTEQHLNLETGSTLSAGGAAAVADGACSWMKLYGNSAVPASGSKLCVLWLDSQLGAGGAVQGTEYVLFITAGGSVPRAAIGFKTTSGGWTALARFEDSGSPPIAAAVQAAKFGGNSTGSIQFEVGSTIVYVPYFDALS